jgi:hypothetical protein
MLLKGKTQGFSDLLLAPLNRDINKFLYVATVKANQVIVVRTLIELINRPAIAFAGLKMTPQQETRLFKLGEYPIDRSQTNVFIFFGHGHEDFFGTEMRTGMLMKKIQDLHTGSRGF